MFLVCQFFKMLACHRSCQRGRRRNRRAAEETREANARGAKGAVGRPGERRGRPDVRRKRRVVRCAARAEAETKTRALARAVEVDDASRSFSLKKNPSWHNERRRAAPSTGVSSDRARAARGGSLEAGRGNAEATTRLSEEDDVGGTGRVANDGALVRRRSGDVDGASSEFCRYAHFARTVAVRAGATARVPAQQIPSISFRNPLHRPSSFSPSWRRWPAPPWRRRCLPAPSWTPPRRRSWFSQTPRCRTSGACRRRRAWRARRARC